MTGPASSSNPIRLLSLPTDHEALSPLVQIHQVVAMPTREALLTWRDMKLADAAITSRTSDVPLRATEAACVSIKREPFVVVGLATETLSSWSNNSSCWAAVRSARRENSF